MCVDHKPLLSILGDKKNLEHIPNPRIMNFKLKSLMYKFQVKHIPGKQHVIPDTFSRRQDSPIVQVSKSIPNQEPNSSMSSVLPGYSTTLGPPAWISTRTVSALSMPTNTTATTATFDIDELLAGIVLATIAGVNI